MTTKTQKQSCVLIDTNLSDLQLIMEEFGEKSEQRHSAQKTNCGVHFSSVLITVKDRDSPGLQCAPVTLPLRPLGAEMCLQL